MPINFDLLKKLCETPGISSREDQVRDLVIEELRPLTDEISVDTLGNVIAIKKGNGGPRVMLAAHMDEIGFLVKFVDDKGFLRLQPVGGWDPRTMVAQRVHVHGYAGQTLLGTLMPAAKPIHLLNADDIGKPPKIDEFFVDLGLPGTEVKALVEIGDMVTMARTTEQIGNNIVSKSLDDRLSVFVMIEALRAIGPHEAEIIAVATTQEEVGLRGATTAAYALEPQIGIALDVTLANDFPGTSEQDQVTRLGEGAALKIMDSSTLSHPKLLRHFRDLAEKHGIKHQLEILSRGGTDAGGIQRSRAGVPTFTLSLPTRYIHTVNEMASVADIEAATALLARYLEDAHNGKYD
ncbi:MAG: M42 family metallopeptidase [Janthinobacterium lividum]